MTTPQHTGDDVNDGTNPDILTNSHKVMMRKHPIEFAFETSMNPAMQEVIATIKRVAASPVNVLITGETGTGKEWAANLIHRSSTRSAAPIVTVECGALAPDRLEKQLFGYEAITWQGVDIKPGSFEEARDGTVFMNEIGQVPPPLLMRVARAVEFQRIRRIAAEDEVGINARLICTLSVQAHTSSWKGTLGEEVLHRLSPIHVELLPLRRRREDIPQLAAGFLNEMSQWSGSAPLQLSPDALEACVRFDWPGNVRHLRNAIEYASVMCNSGVITPQHLPDYLHDPSRKG